MKLSQRKAASSAKSGIWRVGRVEAYESQYEAKAWRKRQRQSKWRKLMAAAINHV